MEHLQLSQTLMFALALVVVAVAPHQTLSAILNQNLPGCNSTCGNIEIPYPFGIGYSSTPDQRPCFFEPKFSLTCENSTLIWGNVEILSISLPAQQMDVLFWVSQFCNDTNDNFPWMQTFNFSISRKENKFMTVGCDSFGVLNSFSDNSTYSTGCLTRCYGNELKIDDGTCSGIGCCRMDIPPRMRDIEIRASIFSNSMPEWENCSYSFVAKQDSYNFSTSHLRGFPQTSFPLVLDWTVGHQKCKASESRDDYACRSNSYCDDTDSDIDYGYRCRCKDGYEGNPYLGCTGVGAGIFILFMGTTLLYLIYQKKKLIKLREKYFQQNGGSILLQQLSRRENSSQVTQIFTEEQLKKATNNFDESLIIGSGGYGTVFKGFLADNNRTVAIKKSKIVDESQKEQFINEIIVLSQINHRNVVKLLGCCLEREVPLLVYEFVNNGTLYDFLHTERKVNNETWKTRLRIAAESAGALSYLHSEASIPVIHRDVKTANILLDNTYTAKVSDFGASRLVPLDQTEIATMVQGTFGYLDPEYMLTSQLTEKSDVYSFGVVLVELLTGEKPHSFGKPEEKRSLANHFLSCLKEDRLFDVFQVGIVNEENKKEIVEVAILAAKCLRLNGEERPSMKEVAMELDAIRQKEKHPWISGDQNIEETQFLLHDASSSIYADGDSSSHQYTTGYDSIRDHVLIALDNGR
ncbi:hypothetical protein AAZV13_14G128700 [Glycine max]|nr:hypothetical protein JHK85_040795 [Glycine max]